MSKIDLTDAETIATLTDALTRAGVEGLEDHHARRPSADRYCQGKDVAVSGSATTPQASTSTFFLKAPLAGHFDRRNRAARRATARRTGSAKTTSSASSLSGRSSFLCLPVARP